MPKGRHFYEPDKVNRIHENSGPPSNYGSGLPPLKQEAAKAKATHDEYSKKLQAMIQAGPSVGDIISVYECMYGKPQDTAIIRTCRHTNHYHVVMAYDCLYTEERIRLGPRFILVSFDSYSGPGLKGYLENQGEIHELFEEQRNLPSDQQQVACENVALTLNIKHVRVTRKNPNSVYCEIVR